MVNGQWSKKGKFRNFAYERTILFGKILDLSGQFAFGCLKNAYFQFH